MLHFAIRARQRVCFICSRRIKMWPGRSCIAQFSCFARVNNGKIAELWWMIDTDGIANQLGITFEYPSGVATVMRSAVAPTPLIACRPGHEHLVDKAICLLNEVSLSFRLPMAPHDILFRLPSRGSTTLLQLIPLLIPFVVSMINFCAHSM